MRYHLADLSVVIPVFERPEVRATVSSLLLAGLRCEQIAVYDAQSHSSAQKKARAALRALGIDYVIVPNARSKSVLINVALRRAHSELTLISDADIVWNITALNQLIEHTQTGAACCVARVVESRAKTIGARARYCWHWDRAKRVLKLARISMSSDVRPGYGLIMCPTRVLIEVGGYWEGFVGWGWEDQDLLCRLSIHNVTLHFAGEVIHLSHSDQKRCWGLKQKSVDDMRNSNISKWTHALRDGSLRPGLSGDGVGYRLRVVVPSEFGL